MRNRAFQITLLVATLLGVRSDTDVSAQSVPQVGYALISSDSGTPAPVGTALFTFTNAAGLLVSQAGVGATEPIRSGRIFVDENGTQTGVAVVNPGAAAASVVMTLRNAGGSTVSTLSLSIPARNHLSFYVRQRFTMPAGFQGSLTFDSDQPLAAIALREALNRYGEPLYTTLPVTDLSAPPSTARAVFPHMAAGGGYTTEVALMNTTSTAVAGTLGFLRQDGTALSLQAGSANVTSVPYSIPANGTWQIPLDRPAGLAVGWIELTPSTGSAPQGTAIFRYRVDGQLMTEAGVPATPQTTLARIFVDNASTQTGLALANPGTSALSLTLRLIDTGGNVQASIPLPIDARGQAAKFANELFPDIADGFNGVLEISGSGPFTALTLKLTTNARGDVVLTTLPVADLAVTRRPSTQVFPQIAIGGSFSTRLIFINSSATAAASGRLNFHQSDGSALPTPLGAAFGNQFPYQYSPGGGGQLKPGVALQPAATITLLDAETGAPASEVSVTEGGTSPMRLRFTDANGQTMTDAAVSFNSLDPAVAAVDSNGSVAGRKAGFSTLTITSGSAVLTATITVVKVDRGQQGFQVTGIVQDLANRLYLATASNHVIYLKDSLNATPAVYAGTLRSPGLRDGPRSSAQFNAPTFLAMNQSDGSLLVADSANNVIRRVTPGSSGIASVFAGTGAPGSADGPLTEATFKNPQGVALDGRGGLWVADSGNHTIRRIDLTTGTVRTVAGTAGAEGSADGTGETARFRSPTGLSVVPESTAQQLDRERRGQPAPPVSVVVADRGNGVLRRVSDDGTVQTVPTVTGSGTVVTSGKESGPVSRAASVPVGFSNPLGVVADAFGNVFVSEPGRNRVRAVLANNTVVAVGQAGTFQSPGAMFSAGGSLVIANRDQSAAEVAFGPPNIAAVAPPHVDVAGGQAVTLTGNNFSPDSVVMVAGAVIRTAVVHNTGAISFTVPPLPSGTTTVTVQSRGGIGQAALRVVPPALNSLPPGAITTIAGGATFFGDGGPAALGTVNQPNGFALDSSGNVYVADSFNNKIRRISARTGVINTVAGNGRTGSDDGVPAIAASIVVRGLAVDAAGNLFISNSSGVSRVAAASGIIRRFAGRGSGPLGDGGPATQAYFSFPAGMTVGPDGNLYVADWGNHRIRKITLATGIVTTVAGSGPFSSPTGFVAGGFGGDGGPATAALLNGPWSVSFDSAGNMLIADRSNNRIRKVDAQTGIISTASTAFSSPNDVRGDRSGGFYVSGGGSPVRHMDSRGTVTTACSLADCNYVLHVALDSGDNLLMSGYDHRIHSRSVSGRVSVIVGTGAHPAFEDGIPAVSATTTNVWSVAVDAQQNVFLSMYSAGVIRKINGTTGIISHVAGVPLTPDARCADTVNVPASSEFVPFPAGMAVDDQGNLHVAEFSRVRRIDPAGLVRTIAGRCFLQSLGDDGPATVASIRNGSGVALDRSGNVYVADYGNNRIRRIDGRTGIITTVAGNGTAASSGDGGPATQAAINVPSNVLLDRNGNLLILEVASGRVRKVDPAGIISTLDVFGSAMALDASDNLYVANRSRISRRSAQTGAISNIAGFGTGGDGGPAISSRPLQTVTGMAFDSAGNLYIADREGNRVLAIKGPIP